MMTPAANTVISIRNLSKEYGKTRALSGVDLDIPQGSVVGVLGPNGSGKTTLLKHICGLLRASHGHVITLGHEALDLGGDEVAQIGYVSQESELLDWLTVGETIDLARAHHPEWDATLAQTLMDRFELKRGQKVGSLSLGQKQRLSIVLGVSHRPKLLLLDEPAASLDPVVRQDFLDLLMELIQDGERTILISSHILTDVEKVIDQVLIMDRGTVHCFQPLDDLREEYYRVELNALQGSLPEEIALTGLKHLEHDGAQAVATVHNPDRRQLDDELDGLNCRTNLRNLDFEEIYRLVVTGRSA
jgi:ABC-2 type transport system ATP-binding protein